MNLSALGGGLTKLFLLFFILLTGCLDTDGEIEGTAANGSNDQVELRPEDILPGLLNPNVMIGDVSQMPSPINGSACNPNEILEWNGTDWICVPTPSVLGGAATTVPASGIQPGAIQVGVTLPANQISGSLNPSTQIGAGAINASATLTAAQLRSGCANTQILVSDASGNFSCQNQQSIPSAPVSSVYGRTGAVLATAGDYSSVQITNVPTGSLSSTNVQNAINELAAEKLNLVGGTMTGSIDMGSNVINNVGTPVAGTDATTKAYVDSAVAGVSTSPGGATTEIQFNGAGSFAGDSNLVWDNVNKRMGLGTATPAVDLDVNTGSINASEICDENNANCIDLSVAQTNGTVTSVAAGAGLSGGTITGSGTISIANQGVDTAQLALNAVTTAQILNETILNEDIVDNTIIATDKLTSACTNNQILQANGSGNFVCANLPAAPVTSVYGRTGVVVATAGDYAANQITNTPAGSVSAVTTQAAIDELDSEKLALAGGTMSGALNMGSNVINNLGTPVAGTDATNKAYVDTAIAGVPSGADNLGNHTAGQALNLNGNFLSGDGDAEGVFVDASGNVGIGTTVPISPFHVRAPADTGSVNVSGVLFEREINPPSNAGNASVGVEINVTKQGASSKSIITAKNSQAVNLGSGNVTQLTSEVNNAINSSSGSIVELTGSNISANNSSTGTITRAYAVRSTVGNFGSGIINEAYAGRFRVRRSSGTITNGYGVYIEDTEATNDFGVYQAGSDDFNYFAGNVGIGTTSPLLPLHVYSPSVQVALMESTGANSTLLFRDSGTGPTTAVGIGSSANDLRFVANNLERVRIDNTGNVGIGTTSPTEKLDVNGNIKGTNLCIGNDCRSAWPGSGGGGTVTSVATGAGLTGGPITGSGTISIANSGVDTLQLANDAVTTTQIENGTITNDDISANTINATQKLTSACSSNQILQANGSGNFVCANLTTAPVTSVYGRTGVVLALAGDYIASQIDSTAVGGVAATNVQSAIAELDVEKLNVAGDTMAGVLNMGTNKITGLGTPTLATDAVTKAYADGLVGPADNLGNHTAIQNLDLDDNLLVGNGGSAGIAIDTSGNVGIGTTNPTEELVVAGDNFVEVSILSQQSANGDNLGGFRFSGLDSASSQLRYAGINGAINESLVGATEGTLNFQTVGPGGGLMNRMNIVGGNVGIGTTVPSTGLAIRSGGSTLAGVLSQVDIASNQTLASDTGSGVVLGTGNTRHAAIEGRSTDGAADGRGYLSFSTRPTGGVNLAERVRIDHSGNVGIGSTSPEANLHIVDFDATARVGVTLENNIGERGLIEMSGSTNAQPNDFIIRGGNTNTGEMAFGMPNGAGNNFRFDHGAQSRLFIEAVSGNVGIGTTSPTEKLDVNGNIKGVNLCIGNDCRSAWPGSGGGGTVTSVATGAGLTGGTITGSGTISISNQGVDTLQLANDAVTTTQIENGTITNDDIAANTINAVTKLTSACSNNQILQANGSGNFVCANLPTPPVAPVTSVYGRTGVVLALSGDYIASQIDSTAVGGVAATNVQSAIAELDSEKLNLSGGTMTGALDMGSSKITGLGTPTLATDATTKSYVDTAVSGASATPGGATTQIQFNNAGSFDGDSNLVWDNANKRLGIGVANPAVELVLRGSGGSVEAQIGPSSDADAGAILTLNSKLSGVERTAFVQTNYNGALELKPHLGERLYVSDGTGSEIFTITPNGSVGVGVTSPTEKLAVESSNEDVELSLTNSSSTVARFPVASVVNYDGAGLGGYPSLVLANIRGSKASPSPTLDGDTLGSLNFGGAGTAAVSGAEIKALAEGDFTASSSPGSLVFQTTPAGSLAPVERMKITESGNVGIGTTAPADRLHILGGTYIQGDGTTEGLRLTNATSILGIKTVAGAQDSARISSDVAGDMMSFNMATGNVGIGTASPAEEFHIADESNTKLIIQNTTETLSTNGQHTSLEFRDGAGAVTGLLGFNTAGQGMQLFNQNTGGALTLGTSGTSRLTIANSGNVGIGTTSPEVELDVDNGVINASQICDENNSNCIDLSSGVAATSIRRQATEPLSGLVSGDVYFNTTDNTTYVFTGSAWTPVAQNGDSNSVVSAANPTTAFPGAVSGDVAFNSTSGHLEFYNGSSWVSTVTAGGDDLGDHTATQNLDLATNLLVGNGGSAGVAIDASGNVGIGTATPLNQLHISSTASTNIRVSREDSTNTAGLAFHDNSTTDYWHIGALDGAAAGTLDDDNFSIYAGGGAGTAFSIDHASGNVGIGTTIPAEKLEVSGVIRAGDSSAVGGSTILVDNYTSGHLTTFGTEQSSGGPSIGYGVVPSSSGPGAFDSSTPIALARSAINTSSTIRFFTGANQTVATGSPVTLDEVMRITNAGNVGIGTTSPGSLLSVESPPDVSPVSVMGSFTGSNAAGDSRLMLSNNATTARVTDLVFIDGNANGAFNYSSVGYVDDGTKAGLALSADGGILNSNTVDLFIDDTTGNVGIGTIAPTAKLSVNGSANKPGGGSWTVFSDIRLKDESSFKNFDYGLDEVMKLQPIHYNYALDNELELDSDERHIGFVAQEVQKIVPEAVNQNESGYLEINNDPIIWTILNAVKELALKFKNTMAKIFDRISGVESQVAALKKENQDIKAENAEIKKELAEIKKMLIKSRAPAAIKD